MVAAFRAAILLRSLGYERGVSQGAGELVIVVVFSSDATSQADGREMSDAFLALASRMKIGTRSIVIKKLEHRKSADTAAQIRSLSPAAVYFARGLEASSLELSGGTEVGHFIAMCADGAALGAGCALGVRALGDSSQLVIDMKRAQKAGLSFDPRMLRLAYVLP